MGLSSIRVNNPEFHLAGDLRDLIAKGEISGMISMGYM